MIGSGNHEARSKHAPRSGSDMRAGTSGLIATLPIGAGPPRTGPYPVHAPECACNHPPSAANWSAIAGPLLPLLTKSSADSVRRIHRNALFSMWDNARACAGELGSFSSTRQREGRPRETQLDTPTTNCVICCAACRRRQRAARLGLRGQLDNVARRSIGPHGNSPPPRPRGGRTECGDPADGLALCFSPCSQSCIQLASAVREPRITPRNRCTIPIGRGVAPRGAWAGAPVRLVASDDKHDERRAVGAGGARRP